MKIILGIILSVLGAVQLFFPYWVWIFTDSWKVDSKSEPNGGYLLYLRIVGAVAMVIGAILLIIGILEPKETPAVRDSEVPKQEVAAEGYEGSILSAQVLKAPEVNFASDSTLALNAGAPCVLSDGKCLLYKDGKWTPLFEGQEIKKIYTGEIFFGLTADGKAVADGMADPDAEGMPLSSSSNFYNAEAFLKSSEDEPVRTLWQSTDDLVAIYESGETDIFSNGEKYPVSDSLNITDAAGNFLLTDTGEVCQIKASENLEVINVEKASDSAFQAIAGDPQTGDAIGIKKDSSLELLPASQDSFYFDLSMDVKDVKKVVMSSASYAALLSDGSAKFFSGNGETEYKVNQALEVTKGRVTDLACQYEMLCLLLSNGEVHMIDFSGM